MWFLGHLEGSLQGGMEVEGGGRLGEALWVDDAKQMNQPNVLPLSLPPPYSLASFKLTPTLSLGGECVVEEPQGTNSHGGLVEPHHKHGENTSHALLGKGGAPLSLMLLHTMKGVEGTAKWMEMEDKIKQVN